MHTPVIAVGGVNSDIGIHSNQRPLRRQAY